MCIKLILNVLKFIIDPTKKCCDPILGNANLMHSTSNIS